MSEVHAIAIRPMTGQPANIVIYKTELNSGLTIPKAEEPLYVVIEQSIINGTLRIPEDEWWDSVQVVKSDVDNIEFY